VAKQAELKIVGESLLLLLIFDHSYYFKNSVNNNFLAKNKQKSNNIKRKKNIYFLLSLGCVNVLFSVYRLFRTSAELNSQQVRRYQLVPVEIPMKPLKICALWSEWETERFT
jgi:hypothetical protein